MYMQLSDKFIVLMATREVCFLTSSCIKINMHNQIQEAAHHPQIQGNFLKQVLMHQISG